MLVSNNVYFHFTGITELLLLLPLLLAHLLQGGETYDCDNLVYLLNPIKML